MSDKEIKFDDKKAELFAKWYLRLNGYFIVDSFLVHNPNEIYKDIVGQYTETDLLAVRFKSNKEVPGGMEIQKDEAIIDQTGAKIDFLITEVKTGNQNSLNSVWNNKNVEVAKYILRYAGFIEDENTLSNIAQKVVDEGSYYDEKKEFAIRLVLISQKKANRNWQCIENIRFDENIIDYFINVWGKCWEDNGIGSASKHDQWDDFIKQVFAHANNLAITQDERKQAIKELLREKKVE